MKKGCAILFLFLASFVYGQNATLLQNTNYRAEELKHSLNKTGDTLILEGERAISRVDIFNSDFEDSYVVNKTYSKIPLTNFPNGRYVTQVKVHDKLIIMTLLRHAPLNSRADSNIETDITETKLKLQNNAEGKSLIKEAPEKKAVRFYWIVKNINKGHSSSKLMRIGDKEIVDRMIAQHKIDLKSKAGKRNQLVIWEVYDTTSFMRFKRQNPDYASASEADCFNTVPFFKSSGS